MLGSCTFHKCRYHRCEHPVVGCDRRLETSRNIALPPRCGTCRCNADAHTRWVQHDTRQDITHTGMWAWQMYVDGDSHQMLGMSSTRNTKKAKSSTNPFQKYTLGTTHVHESVVRVYVPDGGRGTWSHRHQDESARACTMPDARCPMHACTWRCEDESRRAGWDQIGQELICLHACCPHIHVSMYPYPPHMQMGV